VAGKRQRGRQSGEAAADDRNIDEAACRGGGRNEGLKAVSPIWFGLEFC
jgi:hypothetical protein